MNPHRLYLIGALEKGEEEEEKGKGKGGRENVCVGEIQMTYWVTGTGWKGDILL